MIDGGAHLGNFSLGLNATLQHAYYAKVTGANGSYDTGLASVGKDIEREPRVRFALSPSYRLNVAGWEANVFSQISYIGRRPYDNEDLFYMDPYTKVNAGFRLSGAGGWVVQLSGDNINNSHGFTEGNPRASVVTNALVARPIPGRSFDFAVTRTF